VARATTDVENHQAIMALNFVFDRVIDGVGVPNLARHSAQPFTPGWKQYDQHWPYVVPLRLLMYLQTLGLTPDIRPLEAADQHSWYPVAFSWFDFSVDYFDLVPKPALAHRILFYYHEGDNPKRIRARLDQLADQHGYDRSRFLLVSANSAAAGIDGCVYFDDHECFFSCVNRQQPVPQPRTPIQDFTLLNRTSKWWRASITSDLKRLGLLDNSVWSYNTEEPPQDHEQDNPISVYEIDGLAPSMHQFLAQGPYRCDDLDPNKQNDHHWVNTDLYQESYLHIVLETHFDADQSGGTFVTEKTYKAIKYGQPFVVAAPSGTLAVLREHGYRVFDGVIDNSYDDITDNTERWLALRAEIARLRPILPEIWNSCQSDVTHNQEIFHRRMKQAVNTLLERMK
jgi:hypothetical protein